MKKVNVLLATALTMALGSMAMNASACSTVVVGKDVSATGEILIGHNEDNDLRIVTSQYWVPAADHKAGEMITYEPTTAKIPQVAHTYGFYWTQTLHPAGYSFSDGFVNENGVIIVTNNCNDTFEENNPVVDGGVGYGIRRLLAERAKTARDAVDIAIDLVTKYGYITGGRTYTVADRNEAWQIMLLKGHRYIARKVQDNEVTYIANAFAFDKIDVNSKDVIMSPDLIEHAIKTGKYKPAKAGDYSDFSFRESYQPVKRRAADWNKDRAQTAWEMLMGKETMDQEAFPYSVKPNKKLTVQDVQGIVSGHWKREDRSSGFFHQSMRDICNVGTFESVVYEQHDDPLYIRGWRTSARPCQTPYVPFFPLAKPAEAQSFMSPDVATAEHFHATPDRFDFKADFGLYTALKTQNLVDYLDDAARADLRKVIDAQQAKWMAEGDSVMKTAQYLEKNVSADKAVAYLHQYGADAYNTSIALLEDAFNKMNPLKVEILADTLSLSAKGTVDVVVFGEKGLDVTKAKKESFVFGITYPDPNVDVNMERAKATKMQVKDVNGDGVKDLVLTFPSDAAAKHGFEGVNTDLWLFGEIDGQKKGGYDLVRIVK